ncbi:MAG: Carboxypeptidase regulatory-like domain [Acidobacteria bacterium]|nr:Carboxypeptidase regulatory-like domain [Acidobacteriota bacterium]
MRLVLACIILLCIAVTPYHFHAQCQEGIAGRVHATFRYPDSPVTKEIEKPFLVRSLAGRISDGTGSFMSEVLVELVGASWRHRIDAKLTDRDGNFHFLNLKNGTYYLRFSKPGFDTLRIKVLKGRKAKSKLQLVLDPST